MCLSCDKSRTIKMFLGTTYSVWNYVPYKMESVAKSIAIKVFAGDYQASFTIMLHLEENTSNVTLL